MSATPYIVTNDALVASPPDAEWHAIGIDATHSLVVVHWGNPNAEIAFEAIAGVFPLARLWEPLPAAAVPLLALLQPIIVATDTVGQALRKLAWPGARRVR